MPASGKSTISLLLKQSLSRNTYDTDDIIKNTRNTEIPEIFKNEGEEAFRDYETAAIKEVSRLNNAIIATGGGAILRPENIRMLKQNGVIFFIDRPLEKLVPTIDRPLASDLEAIAKRYNERYDIYLKTADEVIDADDTPVSVAKKITGVFYK